MAELTRDSSHPGRTSQVARPYVTMVAFSDAEVSDLTGKDLEHFTFDRGLCAGLSPKRTMSFYIAPTLHSITHPS